MPTKIYNLPRRTLSTLATWGRNKLAHISSKNIGSSNPSLPTTAKAIEASPKIDLNPVNQNAKHGTFSMLIDKYNYYIESFPTRTNLATGVIAYGLGDLAAQLLTKPHLDPITLLSMSAIGAYYGIETPFVFKLIDKIPNATMLGKSGRNIAYNFGYGYFFTARHIAAIKIISGSSLSAVFTDDMLLKSIAAWAIWLPIMIPWGHILNNIIPLKYRFVAEAVLAFSFGTVISLFARF